MDARTIDLLESIRDFLGENVSFRNRKPSIKKTGKALEMMVPLSSDPDDPDMPEILGGKLDKMLRAHGVRIEMSIDDTGEDDEQEPWLRISVRMK